VKVKLDENLDIALVNIISAFGHEVDTVVGEHLGGSTDERLFEKVLTEGMMLVTLDLDFASPIRFPPSSTYGIIVLRPKRSTIRLIRAMVEATFRELDGISLKGKLWIVEPGRIRVFDPG